LAIQIMIGNAIDKLAGLPDESVHCVVTSPPYWGLRDYGVSGQIGLEPDFRDYIATMVAVFREVRRVLRTDGTLWLNLGDSYASGEIGRHDALGAVGGNAGITYKSLGTAQNGARQQIRLNTGLKPKDLCGIPWRVAFALQEDGWWLRSDIIWSKPNPMPESVTDRPTKAHEYLFLLTKAERYYYDAEAIAEPLAVTAHSPGNLATGRIGTNGKMDNCVHQSDRIWGLSGYRNKRSVWTVATAPYTEAHFATFPPALIEPCIKAGCPEGGIVLDPFGGAGTTGLVADRLGRNAILIELNPGYAEMARRRITADGPLFARVY
jgi:DNA modification methylase